jgi:hypothetical protein
MKMEPIESSETSAFKTQTPGKYPKGNTLQAKHICLSFSAWYFRKKLLVRSYYAGMGLQPSALQPVLCGPLPYL